MCTGLQTVQGYRASTFGLFGLGFSLHIQALTHTHTRTHTAELSKMPCELKCYLAFYPKKLSRKGDRVLASAFRFVPDLVAFLKMRGPQSQSSLNLTPWRNAGLRF